MSSVSGGVSVWESTLAEVVGTACSAGKIALRTGRVKRPTRPSWTASEAGLNSPCLEGCQEEKRRG